MQKSVKKRFDRADVVRDVRLCVYQDLAEWPYTFARSLVLVITLTIRIAERIMYVATVALFLIPWSILLIAWRGSLKSRDELTKQDWRSYCLRAGLIIATFATV